MGSPDKGWKMVAVSLLVLMIMCGHVVCEREKYRLSLGSCFTMKKYTKKNWIFASINNDKPDGFVWLGDFAYLDIQHIDGTTGKKRFEYDTEEGCKKEFDTTQNDPYYTKFRESGVKIYGIWDDHDSGINDSGKKNKIKEAMRQLFLDYMEEPKDSPRRTRKGGMYESYYLDKKRRVKLILLDGRYDRDELKDGSIPEEEKSSLGAEQEAWLEQEIKNSEALVTLVANGYQILPYDKTMVEKMYTKSREHILSILNNNTSIVYISGDIHMAEVLSERCTVHTHGYEMMELTTSGLTHSFDQTLNPISHLLLLYTHTYLIKSSRYIYFGNNYLVLDFEFDDKYPDAFKLSIQIRDINGDSVMVKNVTEMDFPKLKTPNWEEYSKCIASHRTSNTMIHVYNYILEGIYRSTYTMMICVCISIIIISYIVVRMMYTPPPVHHDKYK